MAFFTTDVMSWGVGLFGMSLSMTFPSLAPGVEGIPAVVAGMAVVEVEMSADRP
ncbi:hypothetical protein ACFV2X_07235 [Streptomyces sp. NPDC059679]|uniref:hypothetical protein n=1 Tax=Streptomyces sp. NPDC059679 TaxID=3346903 RepID=UPI0036CC18C5